MKCRSVIRATHVFLTRLNSRTQQQSIGIDPNFCELRILYEFFFFFLHSWRVGVECCAHFSIRIKRQTFGIDKIYNAECRRYATYNHNNIFFFSLCKGTFKCAGVSLVRKQVFSIGVCVNYACDLNGLKL